MAETVELWERKVGELEHLDSSRWDALDDSLISYLKLSSAKTATMLSSPYASEDATAQIIGVMGGAVIGGMCIHPMQVIADGKTYAIVSASNTLVAESRRDTCLGADFYRMLPSLSPDGISIRSGISRKGYLMCKAVRHTIFCFTDFLYIRRSRHCLFKWYKRMLAPFADMVFWLQRVVCNIVVRKRLKRFAVREVPHDDELLRHLAALVAKDSHRFRENISEEWLKWVMANDFFDVGKAGKRIYGVYDMDGSLVGFCMAKIACDWRSAMIVEWQFAEDFEWMEPWVLLDVSRQISKEVEVVRMRVSSKECLHEYGRLHLFRNGEQYAVIGTTKQSPLRKHEGYKEVSNWRLRPGMADVPFY